MARTSKSRPSSTKRDRRNGRNAPTRPNELVLHTVNEVYSLDFVQSGAGGVGTTTNTINITPSGLLLATRLAGYQALYDQCRLDRVRITYKSTYGTTSSGRLAFYIERDPTAAAVATVALASDQFERTTGRLRDTLSLMWTPQHPSDRLFNLINPGTTSLGKFICVGDGLQSTPGTNVGVGAVMGTLTVEVLMTLRGRP